MSGSAADCATTTRPIRRTSHAADYLAKVFRSSRRVAFLRAVTITGDRDLSEDIVQTAFARIWERRQSWRDPERLRGFLITTVRNLALNRLRDAAAHSRAIKTARITHSVTTPIDALELNELQTTVLRLIRDLSPRRRRVFVLRACHGLSTREVAGLLNISSQTVANHLAAARKRLIRGLRKEGLV